jgi:hypothetical protein
MAVIGEVVTMKTVISSSCDGPVSERRGHEQ